MDATALIDSLERFGRMLPAVVAGLPDDQWRWKPPDGAWSVLEIVRHLGDEEVADFRARIESTFRDPLAAWPKIDPAAWASERNYNQADPAEAVARFTRERAASVAWLRQQAGADWSTAHQHPRVGPVPAGELLASWAAHDMLHLRQIAKRLYQLSAVAGAPYKIVYAGEWRA